MTGLVHELLLSNATERAGAPALFYKEDIISYGELAKAVRSAAAGLVAVGIRSDERVAVYLPKIPHTVIALFATALAGAVFVPINPILKPEQVAYILRDCSVRLLVTSSERALTLAEALANCPDLRHLVLTDSSGAKLPARLHEITLDWDTLASGSASSLHRRIDADMAAILYTSGSTGNPKGVVLSHRNLVAGALSVCEYLENCPQDRLLAVLPFSFDYGLSQLTTAFATGASVALMDYLLPRDVIRATVKYGVSGLAAVPPLWNQLAALKWPDEARARLRYITSSGGTMPLATTQALRTALPATRIYLMYGLTEAFRSTYLAPEEVDRRPESIGKAIPNAKIMVVREDGSECQPGEPGELVHRGVHVALGYWNDPDKTRERFRTAPGQPKELCHPEIAVWSGDQVRRDEEGYFYFVHRKDELIKTSGYRVSPTEVEEVVYRCGGIAQAVALGVPHPILGQAIVLLVQTSQNTVNEQSLLDLCRAKLPAYMVPTLVFVRDTLPRNANGKIDRTALTDEFREIFSEA